MAWLVRGDEVLATVEVAADRRGRARGLIGRSGLDGAFVLRPCRQVHTFGMRFPVDVAFCDRDGTVLHVAALRPRRVSRIVTRAAFAVEAEAGAFARWCLAVGDRVELRG
ncbi:MAG: DUF192 domain-containing protein [Actinomycetota bacterium]